MKQLFEWVIRKTPLCYSLRKWFRTKRQEQKIIKWDKSGRPVPPPHIIKQQTLRCYAKSFGLKILVETGTYYGDMVEAMKGDFDRIFSIELSKELYERARERFRGETNIELIQGDSGIELANLINRIDQPTLFWLDSHYSAGVTAKGDTDTPIYEELAHIFNAQDKGHVIIIDDARCFGADPAYPTIEELREFIRSIRPNFNIAVKDDSIRVTPNTVVGSQDSE